MICPKYADGFSLCSRDSPLISCSKSHLSSRAGVSTLSPLVGAHTAAHTGKQGGIQMVGAITALGVCCAVRNHCARRGQGAYFAIFAWVERMLKKQRAFGTETRMVRVSVPRRRGSAGTRCSTAVSCAARMNFTACHCCVEVQREKFVSRSAVLSFVARVVALVQEIFLWLQRCVFGMKHILCSACTP